MALALLIVLLVGAGGASAQDIFSWWRRDLLEIDLTPGAWVLVESAEISEGIATVERIRCTVLAAEADGSYWLSVEDAGDEGASLVLRINGPEGLKESDVLDSLLELYRLENGVATAKDVDELRGDRLVQRHFEDLFDAPKVERFAMEDTVLAGQSIGREKVKLSEIREQRIQLGPRERVYTQLAVSVAQISPAVPIFGVLVSHTLTELSEADPEPGRALPPLITEYQLRCLELGQLDSAPGLPEAVTALRGSH